MAGSTHPRDGDGQFIRTVEQIERDQEAARLRSRSMSYRQIARALDVDVATAFHMVERALGDVSREPAERVVALELEKLDTYEQAALGVLERRHYRVDHGKLIYLSDDDPPLEDDAPVLAAIDRLVKVQQRRAALLGLDKPERVEHTVMTTADAERLIAEAEEALGITR